MRHQHLTRTVSAIAIMLAALMAAGTLHAQIDVGISVSNPFGGKANTNGGMDNPIKNPVSNDDFITEIKHNYYVATELTPSTWYV